MSYEATQSFIQEEVVSFSIASVMQYTDWELTSFSSVVFQTMTIEVWAMDLLLADHKKQSLAR